MKGLDFSKVDDINLYLKLLYPTTEGDVDPQIVKEK